MAKKMAKTRTVWKAEFVERDNDVAGILLWSVDHFTASNFAEAAKKAESIAKAESQPGSSVVVRSVVPVVTLTE